MVCLGRKAAAALRLAAALGLAAALSACVHPQSLEPHVSTIAYAEQKIGAPSARVQTGQGTRLVYYWPGSRQCWWLLFDKDGKFLSTEEAFNDRHFSLLKIGESTTQDLVSLFGVADEIVPFALSNTVGHAYRYEDENFHRPMKFWAEFNPKGILIDTACVEDEPLLLFGF